MHNGYSGKDVGQGKRAVKQETRCIGQQHDPLTIPAIDDRADWQAEKQKRQPLNRRNKPSLDG